MPVFEERFQVGAPAETVWALLNDPVRLAPCLPGCQALEVVDPDTYRVTLSVKVGFLSTTQDMRMTVVEKDPPRRLVAVGRVLKPGRTLIVAQGEVYVEQQGRRKQVATMLMTLCVVKTLDHV